jgi:hypothetical protein
MEAQKGNKAVPVTDKKGKKLVSSSIIENILQPPTPGYPEDKERRVILQENVKKMGCKILWDLPWRYFDEQMLKEVVAQQSTSFLSSIRAKPDDWTLDIWSKKWVLSAEGRNLPPRKENLAKEYFSGIPSRGDR